MQCCGTEVVERQHRTGGTSGVAAGDLRRLPGILACDLRSYRIVLVVHACVGSTCVAAHLVCRCTTHVLATNAPHISPCRVCAPKQHYRTTRHAARVHLPLCRIKSRRGLYSINIFFISVIINNNTQVIAYQQTARLQLSADGTRGIHCGRRALTQLRTARCMYPRTRRAHTNK